MNEVIEVASEGLESSTPATDVEKTEPTSFYDNFEGDDRGYLETKGWDSPQKVLEGYRNLETAYGDPNKVVLPGENSTPEQVGEFWSKLGKPDDAGDYQLNAPENFSGYSEELSESFRSKAHELNLPAGTARDLHDWFVEQQIGSQQQITQMRDEQLQSQSDAAKKEFGDKYNEMVQHAGNATAYFNRPGFQQLIEDNGLQNHPEFIAVFGKLGEMLSEPNTDGTGLGTGVGAIDKSPEAMIREKKEDPEFMKAYTTREHPAHDKAVKEMDALYTNLARSITED
tara:strand:- start:250 stop:1101 length:852 start_codon:yes stop_codon:yes gene_type:complete